MKSRVSVRNFSVMIVLFIVLSSCETLPSLPPMKSINNFESSHDILTYVIRGPSMTPTFSDGQKVLVDFDAYNGQNISRSDIVAFKFDQSDQFYVKRVIAIPGDKLEFSAKGIVLNGDLLVEPYINYTGVYKPSFLLLKQLELNNNTVPTDKYILLGDGRDNSIDSATYGPIPREYIKGKVIST